MIIPTFPKETKKGSFYDVNGKLYVDCSECLKGANHSKTCSCGRHKTKHKGGCFIGEIAGDYQNK